jgi:hypothetical protein
VAAEAGVGLEITMSPDLGISFLEAISILLIFFLPQFPLCKMGFNYLPSSQKHSQDGSVILKCSEKTWVQVTIKLSPASLNTAGLERM